MSPSMSPDQPADERSGQQPDGRDQPEEAPDAAAHQASVDPAPGAPAEVLFRVMYDAGLQSVGEPLRPGTGRLRLELSPTQMIRLSQELSPAGIRALMLVLEHGYRPGRRIEIVGWGGPWLREHGMRKYESEKAAAELRDKGYIRPERLPGSSHLGRQLGVVPSGIVEVVDDVPGVPRTDGRPRSKPRHLSATPVSRNPGTLGTAGGQPVDSHVSGTSGNDAPLDPGTQDHKIEIPQVSDVSRTSGNGSSTPPSSSSSSDEDQFFLDTSQGQPLARHDLTRFLSQPAVRGPLGQHWEMAVALIARLFQAHHERCADLVEWLGDGTDAQPATRLAQIVVDLITVPTLERPNVAHMQQTFLRSRSVAFRDTTADDFIATFVLTAVTALDSTRPIESWGGWFGAGLKRNSQFVGKTLASFLALLNDLVRDPDAIVSGALTPSGHTMTGTSAEPVPSSAAAPTTYGLGDPAYVDRLRAAAAGTIWEDEIMFAKLLGNPTRQTQVIAAHQRRTSSG